MPQGQNYMDFRFFLSPLRINLSRKSGLSMRKDDKRQQQQLLYLLRGMCDLMETIPLRTTREYFLADADLKTLLRLLPDAVILDIKRSSGEFRHRHGKATMDLLGSIVTVMKG